MSPAPSTSALVDVRSNANSPVPWILRLGTSYVLTKRATVALDLQFVGPVRSGRITDPPPGVDPELDATGVFLVTETARKFVWNIPVGAEVEITPHIFTRFGFLTDNSGAVDAPLDENRELSLDRIGFSASLGGHKNANGLLVGFMALFDLGNINGTDFSSEDPTARGSLAVRERFFIISIGGDVGRTAATVDTTLNPRKMETATKEGAEVEEDTTREVQEAPQKVEEARKRLKDAENELEAAERKQEDLRNLDESDQGAIQGA